jgi:DNA-binding NarL/FixJ family response regulator
MTLSDHVSCLARIQPDALELLRASLAGLDQRPPIVVTAVGVTELGLLAPGVLVVDIDGLDVDPLEMLRRLRFVLPGCMIAVYTDVLEEKWALACHIAGANCLLSKASGATEITVGLRRSLRSGCFTDPSFRAA